MLKKPLKTNQELSLNVSLLPLKKENAIVIKGETSIEPKTLLNKNTNTKEKNIQKSDADEKTTVISVIEKKEETKKPPVKLKPNTNVAKPKSNGLKKNTNTKATANTANTQKTPKPVKLPKTNKNSIQKTQIQQPELVQTQTPAIPLANQTPNLIPNKNTNKPKPKKISKSKKLPKINIIPLGGLNEIGKNMTIYECMDDMFIVDCGLAFPDESMLGIDIVIPDFTFAISNRDKIKGIVLTHGHEDHIGGLAYFLKQVNIPVYGTRLTIGLVEGKLKEHGILNKAKLNVVKPGDFVKMGCMEVEFVAVNHSIPDAVAIVTHSPAGVIVQTGDFKIDYTPIEGGIIDLARFGELGSKGVIALLSDSTNAERPGSTITERKVGKSFETLFKTAEDKRIIIATFASNIHRVQQICDYAVKYKRKVAVSGRSMENVVAKALDMGYLKIPEGVLIEMDTLRKYKPSQLCIITTGSQGEPMAALSRMSAGDHRQVSVGDGDFIIISATPIPGNEKFVSRVVNDLMRLGADVIYESMYEVHVSGHACQDELKLMMSLVNPKFFIPVHGEYRHLKKHSELAIGMGIKKENIIIGDIGRVIEIDNDKIKCETTVPSGMVMVDGLGVGDVGNIVLRDRRHLALDGLIIIVVSIDTVSGTLVSGPDIVSRGFVYVRESEALIDNLKEIAKNVLLDNIKPNSRDRNSVKTLVKEKVGQCVYQKTKRNPMILPIIMEI